MWVLLWRDVWSPIWPNLAASAICVPCALWWNHTRTRAHITAEAERLYDRLRGDGTSR